MSYSAALLEKIDNAIASVRGFDRLHQSDSQWEEGTFLLVLSYLREDVMNGTPIRDRVLRAFQDVCTLVAMHYENTPIDEPMFDLREAILLEYPHFEELPRLADDFGKGNPV